MSALDPPQIDLTQRAISELASQYAGSSNLKAFISTFTEESNELSDALFQVLQQRDLDVTIDPNSGQYREDAVGAQLDVIGRIVGQDRVLLNADLLSFFTVTDYTFPSTDPTISLGDYNNAGPGGIFISYGQSPTGNYVLNDLLYRKFIHIKILKNFTNATTEQLIKIYGLIFQLPGQQPPPIFITEFTAGYLVGVGRNLNRNEQLYFQVVDSLGRRLMPKPVGVYMWGYSFDYGDYFGFQDQPNALGFGNYGFPGVGGKFASYIQNFP